MGVLLARTEDDAYKGTGGTGRPAGDAPVGGPAAPGGGPASIRWL